MAALHLWVLLVVVVVTASEARYLNAKAIEEPRDSEYVWDEQDDLPAAADFDMPDTVDEPKEVTNSAEAVWVVPHNTNFVFGVRVRAAPCPDDGFRRDRYGICREVW